VIPLPFKTPNAEVRCHVLSPLRLRGTHRNSGLHCFSMLPSNLKMPKCRVPMSRDLVPPVPPMIDGSELNREIATRDFDVHANACTRQPRYADTRWPTGSTCSRGLTLRYFSQIRRSMGLRDSSQNFKSSILFLLVNPQLPSFPLLNLSWGLFLQYERGTIPPELNYH
jgi:hypothetical protein